MRFYVLVAMVACVCFSGTADAQECANGQCRITDAAVAIAKMPVAVVKKVVEINSVRTVVRAKPVRSLTKRVAGRVRSACCR